MKFFFRSIIVALCFTIKVTGAYCQEATNPVEINFLNMAAKPSYKKVKYGNTYRIKIINVNLSQFTVEGTSSQLNFNTEMPEIFKGFKLPGYLNLALPPNPIAPKADGSSSPVRRDLAKEMNTISQNLQIISNAIEKINATAQLNNEFKNLFASCNKTYTTIASEKITVVNTFLGTSGSDEIVQANALKTTLITSVQSAIAAKSNLDILIPPHISTINKNIKFNTEEIINPWIEKKLPPSTDPRYITGHYTYQNAVDENEKYASYKDSLSALVTKAGESVAELKKFRDDNKINELVINYQMINESNFTYYSDPIKVNSDIVKFDINITAKNPLPCNIPTKVSINEKYKTIGGWKMDFSSGLFINGGNSNFLGRDLQYKIINDDTVQIESKDGGKRALLSIGALMHIYYRTGGLVNYAISPGLSTTTAFDGINFHLGASAIFGGENRLVITVGAVAREAKILDRNYEFDKPYAKKLMPDSPPTIKVFPKFGWFFSLSYNWSKLKG